jgi:hypothetical protein
MAAQVTIVVFAQHLGVAPFAARYAKRGKPFLGWAIPIDTIHSLRAVSCRLSGSTRVPRWCHQVAGFLRGR